MSNTLGKQFDKATGHDKDNCQSSGRRALYLLVHNLVSFADVPNNDFNPQYKSGKDEPRLPDATCPNKNYDRDAVNRDLMSSVEKMKQIRFLSLERHGTTHDFPLRLEFKPGLTLDFSGIHKVERPVLVVTGLDGKEHAFTSRARWDGMQSKGVGSIKKAAKFITGELQKKAIAASKAAPLQKQVCSV